MCNGFYFSRFYINYCIKQITKLVLNHKLCFWRKCLRSVLRLANVQKQTRHWWDSGLCVKKWFFMCPTIRPHILHWAVPLASLSKYLKWATCEVLPLACCWSKNNNCLSCLESSNWVPPGPKQRENQQSLTNLTLQASSTYFYNYVIAHICRDSLHTKQQTSVLSGPVIFNSCLWPKFTIGNLQNTFRHTYSEELQQKGGISLGGCK